MSSNTAVVGVGNTLLGDEGLGVYAVLELQKKGLPPGVEAIACGLCQQGILDSLLRFRRVIIVDAIMAGGKPGDVYFLSPEKLRQDRGPGRDIGSILPLSLHFFGVAETLDLARIAGSRAEVAIVGMEPGMIDVCLELSPAVTWAMPRLIATIEKLVTAEKLTSEMRPENRKMGTPGLVEKASTLCQQVT